MLLFAGVELAMPAKDQKTRQQFLVMIITAVGIVAINTTVGVLLGLATKLLVEMRLFFNDTNSHK
jgi:MFS superfamily sulfate permease-like transporter